VVRCQRAGLGGHNIEFRNPSLEGQGLPLAPTYDLVTAFDSLHDMTRPDQVLRGIRQVETQPACLPASIGCLALLPWPGHACNTWYLPIYLCGASSSTRPGAALLPASRLSYSHARIFGLHLSMAAVAQGRRRVCEHGP
jgi:hypothetical protein